jgi:dipeptidyl aminopeptidase/acylaminoacyl peptidase
MPCSENPVASPPSWRSFHPRISLDRFVSSGAAPSLIVHGDADRVVPIVEGETMYAALSKAGVPASFVRIEGAGHRFDGADVTRVNAEMLRWFEQHLRGAAK